MDTSSMLTTTLVINLVLWASVIYMLTRIMRKIQIREEQGTPGQTGK